MPARGTEPLLPPWRRQALPQTGFDTVGDSWAHLGTGRKRLHPWSPPHSAISKLLRRKLQSRQTNPQRIFLASFACEAESALTLTTLPLRTTTRTVYYCRVLLYINFCARTSPLLPGGYCASCGSSGVETGFSGSTALLRLGLILILRLPRLNGLGSFGLYVRC